MLDLRLPYFYNLPITVLLVLSVISRLEKVSVALSTWSLNRTVNWPGVDHETMLYLKMLLITLPAMTGAVYFARQFYERNDVHVRETLFILGVINFLGYLIPALLR